MNKWEFVNYTAYKEENRIRFENLDNVVIGYLNDEDGELTRKLTEENLDPINDRCYYGTSIFGWGEQYPQTVEVAVERVAAVYIIHNGRYTTYFETASDYYDQFGEDFDLDVSEDENNEPMSFPIVIFDYEGAAGEMVAYTVEDVLKKAVEHYSEDKKYWRKWK